MHLKKKIPPELFYQITQKHDWLNILFNKQMTAFNIQLMVQSPCFCAMQMSEPMPPCSLLLGCCAFKAVYMFFNQYFKHCIQNYIQTEEVSLCTSGDSFSTHEICSSRV